MRARWYPLSCSMTQRSRERTRARGKSRHPTNCVPSPHRGEGQD